MDDSPAGRKLCPISRQLGSTGNCPRSALTHQNPRADRPAGGQCSYLPTTREQTKQVSGVVAPMNAPHYIETKTMTERDHIQVREEQANRYTSREDFQTIFSEHLTELYQLSFLLTRDPARAE